MERPSTETKYDINRLIRQARKDGSYTNFSDYIRQKIDRYEQKGIKKFGERELAEKIGISYEMLRKIINRGKETRKRDMIIAICIAIEMNQSETDVALQLYDFVPLRETIPRDLVIINAIWDNVGISGTNQKLEKCGYEPLNVAGRKSGKQDHNSLMNQENAKFTVLNRETAAYTVMHENADCLSGLYSPQNFDCVARMKLKENATGKELMLEWDGDAGAVFDLDSSGMYIERDDCLIRWKRTVEPDLLPYFESLSHLIDMKMQDCVSQLNDTRNYGLRVTADFKGTDLTFYGEAFNFDHPEYSEYYQMECNSEKTVCSVSTCSLFMERYLGAENYEKLYGPLRSEKFSRWGSIEEAVSCKNNSVSGDGLSFFPGEKTDVRTKYYHKLEEAFDEIVTKLANRELFIFNAWEFLGIDELIKWFNVKEELDCYPDDEHPQFEFVPHKESFIAPDGIETSWRDLYRALELGMDSVSDICNVRAIYGSIEGILKRRNI